MRFLYPLSRMLEARNPCELFSRQIHMENSLYPNNEAKSRCVFFFVTREQQTVLHSRSSDLWRMGSSWITLCPNFTGKSCYWCSVLALLKAQREKERKSNGNADCIWQRQWEILYITMQHTVLSRKNLARVCQIMLSAPSHVFKKGNI